MEKATKIGIFIGFLIGLTYFLINFGTNYHRYSLGTQQNLFGGVAIYIAFSLSLVFIVGCLGYTFKNREKIILKILLLISAGLAIILYILNELDVLSPGVSYGSGSNLDLIIALLTLIFGILFMAYFLGDALKLKQQNKSYKFQLISAIILPLFTGHFSLGGLFYMFLIPFACVYVILLIFYIPKIIKILN